MMWFLNLAVAAFPGDCVPPTSLETAEALRPTEDDLDALLRDLNLSPWRIGGVDATGYDDCPPSPTWGRQEVDCTLADGGTVVGWTEGFDSEDNIGWTAQLVHRDASGAIVGEIDGTYHDGGEADLGDAGYNIDLVDLSFVGRVMVGDLFFDGTARHYDFHKSDLDPPFNSKSSVRNRVDGVFGDCPMLWEQVFDTSAHPSDYDAGQYDSSISGYLVERVVSGGHEVQSELTTITCDDGRVMRRGMLTIDGEWAGPWVWFGPDPPEPFSDQDQDGLEDAFDPDPLTPTPDACSLPEETEPTTAPTDRATDTATETPSTTNEVQAGCGCSHGASGGWFAGWILAGLLRRRRRAVAA